MSLASDFFKSSGGGDPTSFPVMPIPLVDGGWQDRDAWNISHNGTIVNNITLPHNTGASINGKFEDTVIWSVSVTDIHANADVWYGAASGFWYDDINDRLYTFVGDTGTSPATLYIAYITLETGVVTLLNNQQLTISPSDALDSKKACVTRENISSGNFTLFMRNMEVEIDSSGNIISETARVVSGYSTIGSYISKDGLRLVDVYESSDNKGFRFSVGNLAEIRVPKPPGVLMSSSGTEVFPVQWGSKIKMISRAQNQFHLETFNKTEFEAWLRQIATFGGIS